MKLVKTIFLKAPREHVWKFLVEADRLALWFHRGERDLVPGGPWALVSNSLDQDGARIASGEVLIYDPPSRLVHTFTLPRLAGKVTTCTWDLAPAAGGTLLTLTHGDLDTLAEQAAPMTVDLDKGWDEHFARLRRVTA